MTDTLSLEPIHYEFALPRAKHLSKEKTKYITRNQQNEIIQGINTLSYFRIKSNKACIIANSYTGPIWTSRFS